MRVSKWLFTTLALWMLSGCGGGGGGGSSTPTAEQSITNSLQSAANTSTLCNSAGPADANKINLLILYTDQVSQRYGGDPTTRISHLVQVSNQVLTDSGIASKVALVGTLGIINHDESAAPNIALEDATNGINEFSEVEACRNALKADMVVLFRGLVGDVCGIGWVNGGRSGQSNLTNVVQHSRYMVSLSVPYICQDFTTVHELGHNWGLSHDHVEDDNSGFFQGAQPWARGHGSIGIFNTVMAYSSNFYSIQNSYTFSNPSLTCFGQPCGVPIGSLNQADAVNHLSIVMPHVMAYR